MFEQIRFHKFYYYCTLETPKDLYLYITIRKCLQKNTTYSFCHRSQKQYQQQIHLCNVRYTVSMSKFIGFVCFFIRIYLAYRCNFYILFTFCYIIFFANNKQETLLLAD